MFTADESVFDAELPARRLGVKRPAKQDSVRTRIGKVSAKKKAPVFSGSVENEVQSLKGLFENLEKNSNPAEIFDALDRSKIKMRHIASLAPTESKEPGPAKKKPRREGAGMSDEISIFVSQSKAIVEKLANQAAAAGRDNPEIVAVATAAFHWLAEVDEKNALRHTVNLLKVRAHLPANRETFDLLKKIGPLLPPDLQKLVSHCEKMDSGQINELINKLDKVSRETRGLELLKKTGVADLTQDEKLELERFILYAIGNLDLNKSLRAIAEPSSIQKKLITFTYKTSKIRDGMASVDAISGALHSTGLDSYHALYKSYLSNFEKLDDDFQAIVDIEIDFPFADEIGQAEDSYHVLREVDPTQTRFEQHLGSPMLTSLQELHERLLLLRRNLQGMEQSSQVHDVSEKIDQIIGRVENQLMIHQQLTARVAEFESRGKADDYAPPVTVSHFRNLESLKEASLFLSRTIHDPQTQEIREILASGKRGAAVSTILDEVVHELPGYLPGDIMLEDEAKRAQYKGEGVVYSQLSLREQPIRAATLLSKGMYNRDVFRMQPYFTGSKMHACLMATDQEGELVHCEVPYGFSELAPSFETGLYNVFYRPQFLKLLTPEGRAELEAVWGPLSDEEVNTKLARMYADFLAEFFNEHKEEIQKFTSINGWSAATGFIKDLVGRSMTAINAFTFRPLIEGEQRVMGAVRSIFGWDEDSEYGRALPTSENFAMARDIFCSEFVARAITEIEGKMNITLNSLIQKVNPGIPEVYCFHFSIPADEWKSSIHPNKLMRLITESGLYAPANSSLATQLLVGEQKIAP